MRWLLVCLAVAGCARAGKENSIIGGLTDARPRGDGSIVPEPDASLIDAPTAQVTLDQTTSGAIDVDSLFGCVDSTFGFSFETSYYRVFSLSDYAVATTLHVSEVDFAIASAIAGSGGQQPGKVNLASYGGPLDGTALDLSQVRMVSSVDIQIPDGTGTRMAVPITGDVAPTTNLLVEVMVPDGTAAGNDFFIGTNGSGERHPGYVRSPNCRDITDPTALSSLGFGEVDVLISAIGLTTTPD